MPTEREHTHSEEAPREARGSMARAEIRPGPSGGFLIGAGATLLLAATGILLIPTLAPGQSWIVQSLAERGFTSLPFFAAGTLFTGLWLAVRTSRAHSIAAQYAAMSNVPVIEALAENIGGIREVLHGVRIEFVYLKDAIQSQIERQNAAPATDHHAEGMYRLAASLDQLGQRVEAQIGTTQRQVRESLESVTSAIEVLRHERHDGRIHLGDPEPEGAEPAPHADHEHGGHHHAGEAGHESPAGGESLSSRGRLGVLDLLDDLGRMLPRKVTHDPGTPLIAKVTHDPGTALITHEAFEGVQDEGWDRQEALAGPLPSLRLEGAKESGSAGELLAGEDAEGIYDDLAIVRKLEELRSLLADSRVREALTTMDQVED
jgi:hypothetical protein